MFSHGMYFCLPLLGVVLILRRVVSFLWVREKGMIVPLIYIGYLWRYGGGGGGARAAFGTVLSRQRHPLEGLQKTSQKMSNTYSYAPEGHGTCSGVACIISSCYSNNCRAFITIPSISL